MTWREQLIPFAARQNWSFLAPWMLSSAAHWDQFENFKSFGSCSHFCLVLLLCQKRYWEVGEYYFNSLVPVRVWVKDGFLTLLFSLLFFDVFFAIRGILPSDLAFLELLLVGFCSISSRTSFLAFSEEILFCM